MNTYSSYINTVNQHVHKHYSEEFKEKANEINYENVEDVTSLQFDNQLLDVSREEYEANYEQEGLGQKHLEVAQRKIIAIPKALYKGLICSVGHLFTAAFHAVIGDGFGAKAYLFSAGKDIQESGGWLATLVNDKIGSYLVNSALFMKDCYHRQGERKLDENNPLLQKQIEEIKNKFSSHLDFELSHWKSDENPKIDFAAKFTSFGSEEGTNLSGTIDGIKDAVMGKIFGKPDTDGNYQVGVFFAEKPEISVELTPKNLPEGVKQTPYPNLTVKYVIDRGVKGLTINKRGNFSQ